ncbi:MAG: prepilin-type N-terminal cleavage/methylation domain-containing protein [Acidobacteriota bacterium]
MAIDDGFTLLEVLIAMLLVLVLALGVTPLFAVATRSAHDARDETSASMLAIQKIEQLRGHSGAASAGALDHDVAGFADFLDVNGVVIDIGSSPPVDAVYVRRWSITPIGLSADETVVARVLVTTVMRDSRAQSHGGVRVRGANEALLVTVSRRGAS